MKITPKFLAIRGCEIACVVLGVVSVVYMPPFQMAFFLVVSIVGGVWFGHMRDRHVADSVDVKAVLDRHAIDAPAFIARMSGELLECFNLLRHSQETSARHARRLDRACLRMLREFGDMANEAAAVGAERDHYAGLANRLSSIQDIVGTHDERMERGRIDIKLEGENMPLLFFPPRPMRRKAGPAEEPLPISVQPVTTAGASVDITDMLPAEGGA